MDIFYVYILRSLKNGKFYTGCTKDLEKRIERHNAGETKGNRPNKPFEIVYSEEFHDLKTARTREKHIKSQKSRKYIESLLI